MTTISKNLANAVRMVWTAIGPDIDGHENMAQLDIVELCVELCVDADRLIDHAANINAAYEFRVLVVTHGYNNALRIINDNLGSL